MNRTPSAPIARGWVSIIIRNEAAGETSEATEGKARKIFPGRVTTEFGAYAVVLLVLDLGDGMDGSPFTTAKPLVTIPPWAQGTPLPTTPSPCYTFTDYASPTAILPPHTNKPPTPAAGCPPTNTCPPHILCIEEVVVTVTAPCPDAQCPLTPTVTATPSPVCPTCVTGCDKATTTTTITEEGCPASVNPGGPLVPAAPTTTPAPVERKI
ncbi:hypothetical protein HYFRA_00001980 [Hymenoscyphus fraxineus]|uniref:Uncharacterized protein n=1 Tax=Hymenoscyphus fraxineus TaxID=746836 RepID=A0A9N9KMT9_9HELO|nr:hypothetical protein HYFRA_00001980 [Hymenoscyphus fraxineus]